MPVFNDILNAIFGALRVGGLLAAMPVLGTATMPNIVKVALALTFGVCLSSHMGKLPDGVFQHNEILLAMVAREIGIGLFIGLCSRFIFAVVSMSMEYAGTQMGFSMASIFDPTSFSQVTVLGQIGMILSILTFFALNIHHELFLVVAKSYAWMPPAYPDFQVAAMADLFLDFIQMTFELALKLSMPVIVVMLVIHTILGVIAKTAPQMNLFFNVAISLNVVIGILVTYFMLPQILKGIMIMADTVTGSLGLRG